MPGFPEQSPPWYRNFLRPMLVWQRYPYRNGYSRIWKCTAGPITLPYWMSRTPEKKNRFDINGCRSCSISWQGTEISRDQSETLLNKFLASVERKLIFIIYFVMHLGSWERQEPFSFVTNINNLSNSPALGSLHRLHIKPDKCSHFLCICGQRQHLLQVEPAPM